MATLTSISAKMFTKNQTDKALLFSRSLLLGRSDIWFSRSQNFSLQFYNFLSIQSSKTPRVAPSKLTFDPAVSTGLENAEGESEMERTFPPKTMHVKFQLQKECKFGEQFFLVGDDPMLGLWDPSNAIPLNWSDGHIWTAEMDIPIGLAIQFKFILKTSKGDFMWQPGSDRVFRAWDNNKNDSTIIISEDWENGKFQKILEEEMSDQESEQEEELVLDMNLTAENPGFISNNEFINAEMEKEKEIQMEGGEEEEPPL